MEEKIIYVDKAPTTPKMEELDGLWASACEDVLDPVFNTPMKRRRFLEIKADATITLTISHFENNCEENSNLQLISEGSLEVFPSDINVRDVNFTFNETTLNITNENRVDFYNTNFLCGLSNWELNVPQTVSGLECNRLDGVRSPIAAGTTSYNIFLISNNELQLGDSSLRNILSETARPTQLDLSSFARAIIE